MDSNRQRKRSFYSVLGIPEKATISEIRTAYRKLAKKWHPDKCNSDSAKKVFQEVQEAYSVLSDEGRRAMYDIGLHDSGLQDDYGFGDFLAELSAMMMPVKEEDEKVCTLGDLQRLFVSMFAADLATSGFIIPEGSMADQFSTKYMKQDVTMKKTGEKRDVYRTFKGENFVCDRSAFCIEKNCVKASRRHAKQPRTMGRSAVRGSG